MLRWFGHTGEYMARKQMVKVGDIRGRHGMTKLIKYLRKELAWQNADSRILWNPGERI